MARQRAVDNSWENHHASLQQANNEPLDPPIPSIYEIDNIAARRGLPPEGHLDELVNTRRRIEPAAAENPSDWLTESSSSDTEAVYPDFDDEPANEQEIGAAAQQATEQAVATAGVDAIAFYLPITFYGPRHYGIYIRHSRFYGFCAAVQKFAPRVPWNDLTAAVFQFVLHHEAYHGAVELSCLTSDDFYERQPARTYRKYFNLATGPWRYGYHGGRSPYQCPEEQLAQHAGFSNMPGNPSGIAIRSALIQISQAGPSDYVYDPAAWRSREMWIKAQAVIERGLHRVQSTSLLCGPLPTALDDVHVGVEPQAWFPGRKSQDVLSDKFGDMPVYVVDYGHRIALRFARACAFRNIALRDFIRAVCRKYDVSHDEKGGKHPRLIVATKYKVTYPRSARTTPTYVIEQVASLLKTTKEDLVTQCQL